MIEYMNIHDQKHTKYDTRREWSTLDSILIERHTKWICKGNWARHNLSSKQQNGQKSESVLVSQAY